MYNFENLEVWKNSMDFASDIYKITCKFPETERFCITSQLRRASISIASNIAEGSGRHHETDFIRFLRIALGSIYECITILHVAKNEKYLTFNDFQMLYNKSEIISKMLYKLISSLETKKQSTVNRQLSTNRRLSC